MRESFEVLAAVIIAFSTGWGYGAITGFAWRGIYDAWFRRTFDGWKEKGGLR